MRRFRATTLTVILILTGAAGNASPQDDASLSPAQSRILARIDSLHVARDVPAAEALLTRKLDTARLSDDGTFELELLVRHGRLLVSYGQAGRGAPLLEQAVALAEARTDSLNLARSIRWLSLAESLRGRNEAAGVLYRRLREVAVARADFLHEGWALVGLGWEAVQQGRLEDARGHYDRAVRLFAALGDTDAEIWARNGYALVLQRLGDYQAALALYRELMAVARRTDYTMVEAMACNNAGSLLQNLGDPSAAIPLYERARELHQAALQTREALVPALNIAVCLIEQDRPDEAVPLLDELDRECVVEGFPDLRADVLYELARARGAQGRLLEAAALHRRIAAIPAELPVHTRVRNVTGLGRILAEMDSTGAALAVVEAARPALLELTRGNERLMLEMGYGSRLADAGRTTEALDVLAAVATEAAATGVTGYRIAARARGGELHQAAGRADSALAWYRLAAAAWEAEREVPLDPRWREQRGTYGQLIYPQLAHLLVTAGDPRAAFAAVHAFKARTLSEAMLGPGATPSVDTVGSAPGAEILPLLQGSVLGPEELFLDYYLGAERSYVFAVTRSEVRAVPLAPLPQLTRLLENYRDLLANPDAAASLTPVGRRVAGQLFPGLEDLLSAATSLVWAPDGPLHRIPLAALPTPGGTDGGLLVDSHTLVRIPSAAALVHLRSGLPATLPSTSSTVLAVVGRRGEDGVPLRGPVRETEDLRTAYLGVTVLLDPEPARVLDVDAERPDAILHLAAHAVTDPRHPWRSAFVLGAPPDAPPGGDRLTAGMIARQRLPWRLAVLASCESVGSRALVGEGQLGLSSAFLGAGVPAVIATLWPISDRTARTFSQAFYSSLAADHTVAEALRDARQELRGTADTAHSRAWAAFVLAGDGEARFSLEHRIRLRAVIWLVPVVVLLGALWLFADRRRRDVRAG
jgi:CHAT domain-containing protein/tetratricopeptide (TPR) repeat protein